MERQAAVEQERVDAVDVRRVDAPSSPPSAETMLASPGGLFFQRHGVKLVLSLLLGGGIAWVLSRGGLPLVPPRSAFASLRAWTVPAYVGSLVLVHYFRAIRWRHLLKPLGDPKKVADFYEMVALQHGRLTQQGDGNPSATLAELNGVALSTAQGWVTKARERGLLPPGRRGRAG